MHGIRIVVKCFPCSFAHPGSVIVIILVESEGKHFILLAYDKRYEEKVYMIVLKFASQLLSFPATDSLTYGNEVGKVAAQLHKLEDQKHKLAERLDKIRQREGVQIVRLRKSLEIESKKAILPSKFGKTRNLVVVEGWIKSNRRKELEKMLAKVTDDAVVIEQIKTFEEPPSIMQNPAIIRPFEFLVKFFSLPNSREFDPTLFVSFFFPIFFGMIVGDIAYGILAIILALFFKFKMKGDFWQSVSGMMVLSGVATSLFGFVYGEFLGVEHVFGMVELHPIIHRLSPTGVTELMGLALVLGVIHVTFGFFVGAVTSYVHGHTKHAAAKASWVLLLTGTVAVVSRFVGAEMLGADLVFLISNIGALGVLFGLIGIVYLEGASGAIEIFSVISNIFSYLRLMALGLAAAILAFLISQIPVDGMAIVDMFTGQAPFDMLGILSVFLFATAFVIGHALALILAIFEGSIHAMRLHFVEFFSKFYKGGGKPFKPLRAEGAE